MTGVEQAAPALAAPRRTFGPLACALLGLAFLAPALVARGLTSDARGYGTHCQLWLPPCTLKTLTGIPCPFCGMTTSFAFIAHGRIREGAATQPVGALLFATTILVGLALLGMAAARRELPDPRPSRWWQVVERVVLCLLLAGWPSQVWRTFH